MTFIPGAKVKEEVTQISDERQLSIADLLKEISMKLTIVILHLEKISDEKISLHDAGGER